MLFVNVRCVKPATARLFCFAESARIVSAYLWGLPEFVVRRNILVSESSGLIAEPLAVIATHQIREGF